MHLVYFLHVQFKWEFIIKQIIIIVCWIENQIIFENLRLNFLRSWFDSLMGTKHWNILEIPAPPQQIKRPDS